MHYLFTNVFAVVIIVITVIVNSFHVVTVQVYKTVIIIIHVFIAVIFMGCIKVVAGTCIIADTIVVVGTVIIAIKRENNSIRVSRNTLVWTWPTRL